MALGIPNDPSAPVNPAGSQLQGQVDSGDIDIIVASEMGTGVQSGCAVTLLSGTQLSVAAGVAQIQGGTNIAVSSATLTPAAADGAQPRFDLVYATSGGTPTILQGAPAVVPDFPALSKDGSGNVNVVYLAAVLVFPGGPLVAANIIDKRAPLPAIIADTGWTNVSGGVGFQNSWVDLGGSEDLSAYRKQGNVVRCRGVAASGTINTNIFTLPAGMRPTGTGSSPVRRYACNSNNAAGGLNVNSGGGVILRFGSTTFADLSAIEFTVD